MPGPPGQEVLDDDDDDGAGRGGAGRPAVLARTHAEGRTQPEHALALLALLLAEAATRGRGLRVPAQGEHGSRRRRGGRAQAGHHHGGRLAAAPRAPSAQHTPRGRRVVDEQRRLHGGAREVAVDVRRFGGLRVVGRYQRLGRQRRQRALLVVLLDGRLRGRRDGGQEPAMKRKTVVSDGRGETSSQGPERGNL